MTSSVDPISQKGESLFDFLYVDRQRVSAYCAQLFENGVLTETKTSLSTGSYSGAEVSGGIPGIVKAAGAGNDTTSEGIERRYDASWHTVLNMLKALNERNFISPDIANTVLGQIALVKGRIQILDLRMIQEMWDTLLDWHISQMPSATSAHRREKEKMKSDFRLAAQIIKKFPHGIHMRFFNDEVEAWSSLKPQSLMVNTDDISFKHGAVIPGEWAMVCLVDAHPDREDVKQALPRTLNELEEGMLTMMLSLRTFFGRPSNNYGLTPLAIYRETQKVS